MRTILALLVVLVLTGWILSEIKIEPAEGTVITQSDSPEWRRTAHGWEQVRDWKPITPPSVDLHPGVVGLFVLFVSVFSLVGFENPSSLGARKNPTI